MIGVGTVSGTITGDLWYNKILNGKKLQPVQAFFLFVDDSYVKHDILLNEARENSQPAPESQTYSLDIVGPAKVSAARREEMLDDFSDKLGGHFSNVFSIRVLGPQQVTQALRETVLDRLADELQDGLRKNLSTGSQGKTLSCGGGWWNRRRPLPLPMLPSPC